MMKHEIAEEADFECTVFPDTMCFFCGLCDMARQEKAYFQEWVKMETGYTTDDQLINGGEKWQSEQRYRKN